MRVRHVLISYRVRLDGGRRWAYYDPPTSIRCALLRMPVKGCDSNGMYGKLSTEPRLIRGYSYRSQVGRSRWKPQKPSVSPHWRTGLGPGAHELRLQTLQTP